jgi:hypothetical protein
MSSGGLSGAGEECKKGGIMALVNCSECAREISDKAAACPHCGIPIGQQSVVIKGVSPFAEYHTPIQGKSKGKITVIGYIGMLLLGPLAAFSGCHMVQSGLDQQGFMTFMFGAGISIACYLWARR